MPQVRIGSLRAHLGPLHSVCVIRPLDHLLVHEGPAETGPAAARIEFIQRAEQWLARNDIYIYARLMIFPELIAKRWFGRRMLRHLELHRSQFVLQFRRGWF